MNWLCFAFQSKCARYWPNEEETKEFGNYVVVNAKEQSSRDYTLREFKLSKKDVVRSAYGWYNDLMCAFGTLIFIDIKVVGYQNKTIFYHVFIQSSVCILPSDFHAAVTALNIQGGPKVGIQLLKVGFGSKSRFVVLM